MPRTWDSDLWMVFFWGNLKSSEQPIRDAVLDDVALDFDGWVTSRPRKQQQPFFIGPGGVADPRINAYFDSPRRRRLSAALNKNSAYALLVWLNFLVVTGNTNTWDTADEADIEDFASWRRYDESNPRPVQGNTFQTDISQLLVFYRWVDHVFGIDNPIVTSTRVFDGREVESADVSTHANRQANVKWLSPGAYERFRDVGVLGISREGVETFAWRSRCDERDLAYVEGLYRTGLRMQEWASILISELPKQADDRWFYTLALANGCAKGRYGHTFWIERAAVNHIRNYVENDRRSSIARAQGHGAYEKIKEKMIVTGSRRNGRTLLIRQADGRVTERAVDDLTPALRMRLFVEGDNGLEPAMLWLNENGLPRPKTAWFKTFTRINARLKRAGIDNVHCTQHMLRHSFALRWYTVGKLIRERRLAHLTADEARDFRAEFGSTWHLVQTMLGHRNTETTKHVYLEPFLALDVSLLLEHAADDTTVRQLLDAALREHPFVITVDGVTA
ncbi:tyrosine-type recombinase/integrase [Cryobacterium sp. MDB2-10]|uniref:tyrosine-type recombinase/integrase n=1 Tax=Cryobacterium sp. MDB2-10 TaxID=1259177 RepID=UPI0010734F0E|nr:tyrosine-type recombinase/integrase [Cryobacterium sp. MDB2-10]TFC17148.1 hypothetical protein E3O51_11540 [Cryobacterium sp. MDB2-10]